MTLRDRYSPFNLLALNARLRHSLLLDIATSPEDNADHDGRYYTKDEVNDIVEGNTFDFFLNDTLSGIGSPEYRTMDATPTGDAESTFSDTITGDAFLIDSFTTSVTEPTFTNLVAGIFSLHIHGETTVGANVKTVRLFWELYRRLADAPFTETLLITSEESDILTSDDTEYDLHGSLADAFMLNATDRLVLKVYANIEDGDPPRNTNPLVTLRAEGVTASHFEVVTNITAFDDRYVQVTGDTMSGDLKAPNYAVPVGGRIIHNSDDGSDTYSHMNGAAYEIVVDGVVVAIFTEA